MSIGGNCPECSAPIDTSLFASAGQRTSGMGIASMVMGIISLPSICCCPLLLISIPGLILGILAMNECKNGGFAESSKNMALAGVILCGIAVLLGLINTVLVLI